MEPEEYERIAAAEDAHWWYRSTRALMREFLAPALRPGIRALDVGCGPGGNGAWLAAHGSVVGIDLSNQAVRLAAKRHADMDVARADAASLPFRGGGFDVVIAVTVLNQVPDDAATAAELVRVVRPGGTLLVVEPAFAALRRGHDRVVHTARRYRRGELAALLVRAGMEVRRSTYAHSYLVVPAAALAATDRVAGRMGRPPSPAAARSDVARPAPGRVLEAVARVERRVLTRVDLPVGLSAVVVAERPALLPFSSK